MSGTIHNTQIRQDGKGSVIVELVISDGEALVKDHAPHTAPQGADAIHDYAEAIVLKVAVKDNHVYFPGFQSDAIRRAIEILQDARKKLPKVDRDYQ